MSHVTYQWRRSCPLWAKAGTPVVSCKPQPQQVSIYFCLCVLQPITTALEPPSIQSDCKTVPKKKQKKFPFVIFAARNDGSPACQSPPSFNVLGTSVSPFVPPLIHPLPSPISVRCTKVHTHTHTIDFPHLVSLLYSLYFFPHEIPSP